MNGTLPSKEFWSGISNKGALDIAWPLIQDKIADVLEYSRGEYNVQDVYNGILEKKIQLWIIDCYEGVCLTEVVDFPQLTSLNVMGFAGFSLERGLKLLHEVLVPYARERGASVIRDYSGRRGVVKELIKDGWEEAYYVMELKL